MIFQTRLLDYLQDTTLDFSDAALDFNYPTTLQNILQTDGSLDNEHFL